MLVSQIIVENDLDNLLSTASQKFQVGFQDVKIGQVCLKILQIENLDEYIDRLAEESREKIELPFWAKIWPASVLLGYYVASLAPEPGRNNILELGCGIGLSGLVAASRGFNAVLSDISPDALLFAKINILKNNLQDRAQVQLVDFTQDRLQRKFDHILGSELFYRESGYRGLVKFLLVHLQQNSYAEVVLAADYRRQAKKFFQAADKEFHITQKNIGYKGKEEQTGGREKFLCAIYRMKAKKI